MQKIITTLILLAVFPYSLLGREIESKSEKSQKLLTQVYKQFKLENYSEAIHLLKQMKTNNPKIQGVSHYLLGLNYSRIKDFETASMHFKKAAQKNNKSIDLYYEYGQALYAINELEKARDAFSKSYQLDYKVSSSLYYMGHISQILEENIQAKEFYQRILNTNNSQDQEAQNMLQPTNFQLAEVLLNMAEQENNPETLKLNIKNQVLPEFEAALKRNPNSPLAKEIQARITKIERKYELDPNFLVNGKLIPKRPYEFKLEQKIEYDNNITLATDLPTTQATQKDSYILTTKASGSYQYPIMRRYVVSPDLALKHIYHTDRDNPLVYTNDSYEITPSLNLAYEYNLFEKQATLSLEYEYNYTARDPYKVNEKQFFAYANTFSIGQKFQAFSIGKTGVKLKHKDYNGYLLSLDNLTNSFALDQMWMTKWKHLMLFIFSADFVDLINNVNSSTKSYLFRVDYIVPNFYGSYLLDIAHSFTVLDTVNQQPTRGYEKTFSPQIKISRKFQQLTFEIQYTYQKKLSRNKNSYAYSKHQTGFEIKYKF